MKLRKRYQKNDRVIVKSFAGPEVCVVLKNRYIASESESKLGVDGWEAQIISKKKLKNFANLVYHITKMKSPWFGYLIGR